jgi:hypothetical protein
VAPIAEPHKLTAATRSYLATPPGAPVCTSTRFGVVSSQPSGMAQTPAMGIAKCVAANPRASTEASAVASAVSCNVHKLAGRSLNMARHVCQDTDRSLHMETDSTVCWASAGSHPWSSTTTAHVSHSTAPPCGCTACLAPPQQYTATPCQLSAGPLAADTSPFASSNGTSMVASSRRHQTPLEPPTYEFMSQHNFMGPARHCTPAAQAPAVASACVSYCTSCRRCGAVQTPASICMGCWACKGCGFVQAAGAAVAAGAACLGSSYRSCCRHQAASVLHAGSSSSYTACYIKSEMPPPMAACLGSACSSYRI